MTMESRKPLFFGSETLRWLIGMALAALVAYFTSMNALEKELTEVKATTNGQIAVMKATEESHFGEVQRSLERIEAELIRLRQTREVRP